MLNGLCVARDGRPSVSGQQAKYETRNSITKRSVRVADGHSFRNHTTLDACPRSRPHQRNHAVTESRRNRILNNERCHLESRLLSSLSRIEFLRVRDRNSAGNGNVSDFHAVKVQRLYHSLASAVKSRTNRKQSVLEPKEGTIEILWNCLSCC